MEKRRIVNTWNYYLSIEEDLAETSRFIEPEGQENVHSFEFAKLLVLSCTEVESVMKQLCKIIAKKECGNIGEYKGEILHYFPKIVDTEVTISRWNKTIKPFENWNNGSLFWWDDYTSVKHNREKNFDRATYKSAVYGLSALYILIFYLAKKENATFYSHESKYIDSSYSNEKLLFSGSPLPDFTESDT